MKELFKFYLKKIVININFQYNLNIIFNEVQQIKTCDNKNKRHNSVCFLTLKTILLTIA